VVEIAKLRDYSLNLNHPVGGQKARVFKAALGITVQQAAWLRERALEVAVTDEATQGATSVFGDKYVIDARINYKSKTALVRFCWIIEFGTDFPRLTSCYVR
jgi:tRNA A37 threonylcarbamoyladenosine dehydratase